MNMDSCESHGWWEVDGQEECPSCEIARLRADMERLQHINAALLKQKDGVDKDLFTTVCFERDEALAQVAVLITHITKFPSEDVGFYFDHIGGCQYPHGGQCSCGMEIWSDEWNRIKNNLPAEARALLNRLQRLEQDKRAHEQLYADAPEPMEVKKECSSLEDRLQRAEAVVEAAQTACHLSHYFFYRRELKKALAAWDKGKEFK